MLTSISKIFNFEENKDETIQFWNLIGPLFIILTLFLTSFSPNPNKDLFLLSILGLFLCWKKGKRGFFYSILFLSVISCIKHIQISSGHLWQLGIETSIFFGFIISYYSLEQTSEYIDLIDVNKSKYNEGMDKLKEELQKEEDFHQRQHKNFKFEIDRANLLLEEKKKEIESFKNLAQNLRATIKENESQRSVDISFIKDKEHRASILRQDIEDMKEHILTLENQEELFQKNKKLLNELELLRKEKEESYVINQSLSKMLAKEIEIKKQLDKDNKYLVETINISENKILSMQSTISNLKESIEKDKKEGMGSTKIDATVEQKNQYKKLLSQYEKKYQEFIKQQSLYKQIRKQFDDKNIVLSETRKELFLAKEEIGKIEKEKELKDLDQSPEVRDLYIQIGEFEEKIVSLEEENSNMQDIISISLNKQPKQNVKEINSNLKKKMEGDSKQPISLD